MNQETAHSMQHFTLEEKDHIAHLVLNRPEQLNTMGPGFWRELDAVLRQLNRAGQARALVISSTGKHFSAGMALDTFDPAKNGHVGLQDQTPEGRAAVFDALLDIQSTFNLLEALRMPVIAVVQGGCIGGAVDMLTACCLRYASADAFFCIQEINIGMVADVGTLQRLPKLMPLALVKELAYTVCPPPAPWLTAWSMKCSIPKNKPWLLPWPARAKSPPSPLSPFGAPSKPFTMPATIRSRSPSSKWAGCKARSGATPTWPQPCKASKTKPCQSFRRCRLCIRSMSGGEIFLYEKSEIEVVEGAKQTDGEWQADWVSQVTQGMDASERATSATPEVDT